MVFVWGSLALFFPLLARRLEESPRWYEDQGRTAEAAAAVDRIEQQVAREAGPLAPVRAPESVATESREGGFAALFSPGTVNRTLLLIAVWICQTLGFYGFNAWVPTLLTARGFSIVRSLEQSSTMQIGAVPGAWIAAGISDRWQRKSLMLHERLRLHRDLLGTGRDPDHRLRPEDQGTRIGLGGWLTTPKPRLANEVLLTSLNARASVYPSSNFPVSQ